MQVDRLIVVGTGLMGGSLAAAAKRSGCAQIVIGVDPDRSREAQSLGLIDGAFQNLSELVDHLPPREGAQRLLVLATPVSRYASLVPAISALWEDLDPTLVTEMGSTKHALIEALSGLPDTPQASAMKLRFVPSHPLAGAETSGPQAAIETLFEGARILVSPLAESLPEAVANVESFWMSLGGIPTPLPLEDHDALLAVVSHLPHLISYALAGTIAQGPLGQAALSLHGGGLRDTTRIAGSSAELWADILLDNREELLALMPQWQITLGGMLRALESCDRALLVDALEPAATWRRQIV